MRNRLRIPDPPGNNAVVPVSFPRNPVSIRGKANNERAGKRPALRRNIYDIAPFPTLA